MFFIKFFEWRNYSWLSDLKILIKNEKFLNWDKYKASNYFWSILINFWTNINHLHKKYDQLILKTKKKSNLVLEKWFQARFDSNVKGTFMNVCICKVKEKEIDLGRDVFA